MQKINSIYELKALIHPLLKHKRKELKERNIFLTEDEIFAYFADIKWKKSNNLHLCDIVDDILNEKQEITEVFDK